jgi:putative redox protein
MASEINVHYLGKLRTETTRVKTGQAVQTDVTSDHGGQDERFSPIELTAAALGACVTSVMAIVAERSGIDLTPMEMSVKLEMASSPARRIGSVDLTVRFPNGPSFSDAVRTKLEAAAHACPVKNSLHPDVRVGLKFVYA